MRAEELAVLEANMHKLPISQETMAKFDIQQRYLLENRRISELAARVLLNDLRRTRRTA